MENTLPPVIEKKYVYCPHCQNIVRKHVWMAGMIKCPCCPMWFSINAQKTYTASQLQGQTLPK